MHGIERNDQAKRNMLRDLSDYAQLRSSSPPLDVDGLAWAWAQRDGSAYDRVAVVFVLPSIHRYGDPKEREWQFWAALSHAGVFVLEYYHGSVWHRSINAQAGKPALGQLVVKSMLGTFTLDVSTSRLSLRKGSWALYERLRQVFPPYMAIGIKRKRSVY
jgi:hypothetical protein